MRSAERSYPAAHELRPHRGRSGVRHAGADLKVRPVVDNIKKRNSLAQELQIKEIRTNYVVETKSARQRDPSVRALPTPLFTLGTLRLVADLPD